MPFQIREVVFTLFVVTVLLAAKHIPALAFLPITHAIGIICFSFAIYLGIGLLRAEAEAAN